MLEQAALHEAYNEFSELCTNELDGFYILTHTSEVSTRVVYYSKRVKELDTLFNNAMTNNEVKSVLVDMGRTTIAITKETEVVRSAYLSYLRKERLKNLVYTVVFCAVVAGIVYLLF